MRFLDECARSRVPVDVLVALPEKSFPSTHCLRRSFPEDCGITAGVKYYQMRSITDSF
jgi:hypothetical protein